MKQLITYVLRILVVGFYSFNFYAQSEQTTVCDEQVYLARVMLIGTEEILKDEVAAFNLLTDCANQNHPEALYQLGLLYKNGVGVAANQKKAFKYIEAAANQNHPEATCELGVLYKDGIGCDLNFNTAIEYFHKATELGDEKGAYSIGYIYLKGLGNIDQNYTKAIEWFKKSDYPMAQHWLGICNYFGYGMSIDKQRAMELLLGNPNVLNSEILANHLEEHPNLLSLGTEEENTLKASEFSSSKINEVITTVDTDDASIIEITKKALIGEWNGKLVELDWAGKKINRSFSINLNFAKDEDTDDLDYIVKINDSTITNYGLFLEDSFYFNDLEFSLPRLYQDNEKKYDLNYNVLSANTIEIKEINNIRYLIANMETQVLDWSEPGPPMLLILGNTKALTDNGQEIDEALIAALIEIQDDSFITLYPNPFETDLLIQYDLKEDSLTNVEIYDLSGQFSQTIVANEQQKAGKHLYHIDGTNYPQQGFYVVKITVNNIAYTKLIVKE